MSFGSDIKHAFQHMGNAFKHTAEGCFDTLSGMGHVVKGAVTFNTDEMGKGLKCITKGVQENVKALGEGVTGIVQLGADVSPLGAGVNYLTHGGVNKVVEGTTKFVTSTINDFVEAPQHLVHGVVHGDLMEAGGAVLTIGSAALMVVPGVGEVAMAARAGSKVAVEAGSKFAAEAGGKFAGKGASAGTKAGAEAGGTKAGAKAAGAAEAAAANLTDHGVLNKFAVEHGLKPLEANATHAEEKTLYKKLSLKMHPDKVGGDGTDFKKMSSAFKNLEAKVPSTYERQA